MRPPVLLGPLVRLALIGSSSLAVGAPGPIWSPSGFGVGDNLPMNHSHVLRRQSVRHDRRRMDGARFPMFGLLAAFQWAREARIAAWIAFAAAVSYAEHTTRYDDDPARPGAAVALAIVLYLRIRRPRLCRLPWPRSSGRPARLHGNLSRPLYVSLLGRHVPSGLTPIASPRCGCAPPGQHPLTPPLELVQFPQSRLFLLEHAPFDQQQLRHFGGPRLVRVGDAPIVIHVIQAHPELVLVPQ